MRIKQWQTIPLSGFFSKSCTESPHKNATIRGVKLLESIRLVKWLFDRKIQIATDIANLFGVPGIMGLEPTQTKLALARTSRKVPSAGKACSVDPAGGPAASLEGPKVSSEYRYRSERGRAVPRQHVAA